MAEVPEDLVAWFANESPRWDRYGMPRIEIRWRVLEAIYVFESSMDDEPHIVRYGPIREFRTKVAAERHRDARAKETGHVVLMQAAVVLWLTEDELPGANPPDPAKSIEPPNRQESPP